MRVAAYGAQVLFGVLTSFAASVSIAADAADGRPAILEAEVSDVATLAPLGPHRVLIGGAMMPGVQLVNGDTARVEGRIEAGQMANFAIDPNGKYYYIAETLWTRGNRGTRQDLLTIYDDQLKLVAEIDLPGRLIAVPKYSTFDISADGKQAYVFNMQPAASVAVVDLVRRKVANVVEIPGCGMVYPWGDSGFASLCADGTLASAARRGNKYTVTHTKQFFDPEDDPVFEESLVDRQSGQAFFISFTGLVYPTQLGEEPRIDTAWSMQEAAGLPRASTEAEHLAWRPGGARFASYHKSSRRLYVLMHPGVHWTHKESGTEIWVFDTEAKKRVARWQLAEPANSIVVTQDEEPLLFVLGPGFAPGSGLTVLDARSGEMLRKLPGASGSIPVVWGF
jgi:methylamine dehydrogenase heavy chain